MKFLIDENLPPRLAQRLTARGHEAEHVLQCGLGGALDAAIWAAAQTSGAVVVSRDDDFSGFVETREAGALLFVGLGNCSTAQLPAALEISLADAVARLESGERVAAVR